jgi:hypothetical protein
METVMDLSLRVVSRIPLTEPWDSTGPIPAVRGASLTAEDVRALLGRGPLRVVVADIGHPLKWIGGKDVFPFWKDEVRPHLADHRRPIVLDEFPGGYVYLVSAWTLADGSPVLVLEVYH